MKPRSVIASRTWVKRVSQTAFVAAACATRRASRALVVSEAFVCPKVPPRARNGSRSTAHENSRRHVARPSLFARRQRRAAVGNVVRQYGEDQWNSFKQ